MARPFFDQTEGYALSVLDALAGGRRVHPLPYEKRLRPSDRSSALGLPPSSLEPSEELVRIGSERLAIHLHRFMLRSGGHRTRTVLREGRRTSGRLWDEPLNHSFAMRFTEASRDLWLGMAQATLRPPKQWEPEKLGRFVKVEGTECGDWLFYARAYAHLSRLGISVQPEDPLARRLRSGSPLAVLFTLEPHLSTAARAATHNQLARLLQKGALRIAECLDDALVISWIEAVVRAAQRSASLDSFTQRFNGMAEVLEVWLDVLDEKERLDLAAAVMRLMAALVAEIITGSADQARAEIIQRHAPRTVHDRQAAHAAMARLPRVGVRLAELRDRFAALRYGDERWDEGQLYLAAFDDLLAPHLERLRALERGLRGIIG